MALSIAFESPDLIVVRANGMLTPAEVAQARERVSHYLQDNGPGQCLIQLEPGFAGFSAPNDGQFGEAADAGSMVHQQLIHERLSRMAVVGEPRWRDNALVFLLDSVVPYPVTYFPPEQEVLARAWLAH